MCHIRSIILLLCCFTFLASNAQLTGKWYAFANGESVFDFKKDSFTLSNVNLDPADTRLYQEWQPRTTFIQEVIPKGDVIYCYAKPPKNFSKSAVYRFQIIKPNAVMMWDWGLGFSPTSINMSMNTCDVTDLARKTLVANDTAPIAGWFLYTRNEIERIRKLPSITTMTPADIHRWNDAYNSGIEVWHSHFGKTRDQYFELFYGSYIIAQLGFNGLTSGEDYKKLYGKYKQDSETRKMLEHLIGIGTVH